MTLVYYENIDLYMLERMCFTVLIQMNDEMER